MLLINFLNDVQVSVFRKSAWEYNVQRGQYYLHQFAVGQPDLNFRNAKVVEEMKVSTLLLSQRMYLYMGLVLKLHK